MRTPWELPWEVDQKFNQIEIIELNKKYSVDIFNMATTADKTFEDESIFREFKKIFLRTKALQKRKDNQM